MQPAALTVAASTTGSKTTTLQRNGLQPLGHLAADASETDDADGHFVQDEQFADRHGQPPFARLDRESRWAVILRTRSRIMARALSATSSMQ